MTSQERIDAIIATLCDDMYKAYKDINFSHHDFHDCMLKLMDCVEMMPALIGVDKKKIVVGVLVLIVSKLNINNIEREKITYLLESDLLGSVIDLIIRIYKMSNKQQKIQTCDTH